MSAKLFCEKCAIKAHKYGNARMVSQSKFIDKCFGCGPIKGFSNAYEVISKKAKKPTPGGA